MQPQELAPHLNRWGLLTSDEYTEMNSETPRMKKNSKLLQILPYKQDGRPGSSVSYTYLSLMDSYEQSLGTGVAAHWEVAKLLKKAG